MIHIKFQVDLHGVGVSVVNALSEKLSLKIFKEKKNILLSLKMEKLLSPLKAKGKTNKNGTLINFLPSKEVFSSSIILVHQFYKKE